LALRMRRSSALFLTVFLPCFSLFMGTLQCRVPSHDTDNRSMDLSGYDS
jgi:hypothetical protein